MSKSICKAFKANKNDELYTPKILVDILRYDLSRLWESIDHDLLISETPVAWCPFDTENSEFVHMLSDIGFDVIFTHLTTGEDFFTMPIPDCHVIISNPPFSRKLDVFKRLDEIGKPWAMAVNIMALNYQEIGEYFSRNPCQMIIPDKRVSFDGNPSSFCTGFICSGILDCDLKFAHVDHNNVCSRFVKSRMHLDFLQDELDFG